MAGFDSGYSFYGINAGISGTCIKETACLFDGQPAFLYFIWTGNYAAAGIDGIAFACGGACVY